MDTSERLKNLIARFVLKYNYWGYLFSRIRRRPAMDLPSIMGVAPEPDGTICLYYQPELVAETDNANLTKVIEHEGFHLLNKHIPRLIRVLANESSNARKYMKGKVWNIAADCCVNQQANLREPFIIAGKEWPPMLPEMFKLPENKITEWYFYELLKRGNKGGQGGSGKGKGQKGGMDDHEKWTKNLKGVTDLSSLSRKIDQHVQNIIKESVKTFNKDRGTLPGNVAELIESALMPPKAPYYQIIRKLIRGSRLSKFLRSPTKINRKRTYTFVLEDNDLPQISPFPGRTRDLTFDIVVLIDTSGSMRQKDILEGLSGVKNIIEKDRFCYTTVLEVDTTVEKEYEVNKIRDIQFNIKGRGGTTLGPGLLRARELGCDVCLAFTDGYTENINQISRKLLPKKIIWVIQKDGTSENLFHTGYVVNI